MSSATLCPQMTALETLWPGFIENALPLGQVFFKGGLTAETLAHWTMGFVRVSPDSVPDVLALFERLEDPAALFAAGLTLFRVAERTKVKEVITTPLPVAFRNSTKLYWVPVMLGQKGKVLWPSCPLETMPEDPAAAAVTFITLSIVRESVLTHKMRGNQ